MLRFSVWFGSKIIKPALSGDNELVLPHSNRFTSVLTDLFLLAGVRAPSGSTTAVSRVELLWETKLLSFSILSARLLKSWASWLRLSSSFSITVAKFLDFFFCFFKSLSCNIVSKRREFSTVDLRELDLVLSLFIK